MEFISILVSPQRGNYYFHSLFLFHSRYMLGGRGVRVSKLSWRNALSNLGVRHLAQRHICSALKMS